MRHLFTPSYRWIPVLVFAFFTLSFAIHPLSPFFTHHLIDPDDYMRINEAISWMQGQGWYDLSVPRLSPNAHTVIHWSRLLDLPLAFVAQPFLSLLGVSNAVFAAALIVPLIGFAGLLALLPALGKPLMPTAKSYNSIKSLASAPSGAAAAYAAEGHKFCSESSKESKFMTLCISDKDRAAFSCLLLLFAPLLLFNYTPGRVDHHGVQAIIAGFGLLAFGRIVTNDKGALYAVLSALGFACGFWIGTEALPWVILFTACLGIAAAIEGKKVARNAAFFGFCLTLFTTALVPVALPAAEFSSRALSWFSPAYAIFAGLVGGIFILGWAGGCRLRTPMMRLALYAGLGLAAADAFFILIPTAWQGPFADYDSFDATTALANITEAQPLSRALHIQRFMPATLIPASLTFIRLLFLPLVACGVCMANLRRQRGQARLLWLGHSVFLFASVALTVFWQMRVGVFMELFTLPPLTRLLVVWWDDLRWGLRDRALFCAEIGVFLLLGFLPVVFLPALITPTPIYPDILLFPAARAAPSCPLEPVTAFLNDPRGLGTKPLTILNTGDTAPQLLFATHHAVLAGNFDVPGNADAFAFFHTTDDAQARRIAEKWQADLVLLCRRAPSMYMGKDYYSLAHMRLQKGADGLLRLVNTDASQPLMARLIRGDTPGWLKPIEIPASSDYLMFRIMHRTNTQ